MSKGVNETLNDFCDSELIIKYIHFQTYGTLACILYKLHAFIYQIQHQIKYLCVMEDDVLLKKGFKEFAESKLVFVYIRHLIQLKLI
jgi:GR25 family glycosyltransferase involved in LPS biosynthesis